MLQIILITIAVIALLVVILTISNNLIQLEAQKSGIDLSKENMSIFPKFSELFGPTIPSGVEQSSFHVLRKGHDIKVSGSPQGDVEHAHVSRYAVKPTNFRGIAPIPKLTVAVGDTIKAGDPLFFDKSNPDIKYCSPVSGELIEIDRGEKRSIANVVVLADKQMNFKQNDLFDIKNSNRDQLVSYLLETGFWPFINQKPFDVVADAQVTPRDIFISGFNSGPLAIDSALVTEGEDANLQAGVNALSQLTDGKVYISHDADNVVPALSNLNNAEHHYFKGKHPAGNVGVQIHHIKPIGNSVIWTVKLQDLITLGKLIKTGKFDTSRVISIGGSAASAPKYVKTYAGANVADLVANQVGEDDNVRYISGDVLSGKQVSKTDFINAQDNQITIIEEGDSYELFGWLVPVAPRPSVSGTFPNFLYPNHEFDVNTNTHGEKRAFVVTGQYEKMLPMDIHPQSLMKSIMAGDIERMEGLGIKELSEEDVALCEFSCTSKQPLQEILREGLDMLREQG